MLNIIETLNKELTNAEANVSTIERLLQEEYNKVFEANALIKASIVALESSKDFQFNAYGEVEAWHRFDSSDFQHCRQYFQTYMRESHCVEVDWANDALLLSQGESITIQDDSRWDRDNGVWLDSKRIIDETEYKDDNGEVDEVKRNELIEAWMEKSGFYPGVFHTTQHGGVFLVNTSKKA